MYHIYTCPPPPPRGIDLSWCGLWPLALLTLLIMATQLHAQTNSPATGAPAVTYVTGVTVPTEDSAITAAQGTIADTDGVGTLGWQWSAADTNGGTYTAITSATNAAFTPGDDEVGKFLQVCASFMDMATTPNSEMRCLQIATAVANVNDKPVSINNRIAVNINADADNPQPLRASDFPFMDADKDMLAGVIIHALPDHGTMILDGTALTSDDVPTETITVAKLAAGALTYYPASGQADAGSVSFLARVVDDGSDGTDNKTSVGAEIIIVLTSPNQTAASGAPTIAPATTADNPTYAEDAELTAISTGITEPNGIDRTTLRWQWQSSPASDGTFADINGATGVRFTPLQAHVGMYIRVCASFMDLHTMPETVEDLCSTAAQVHNVPDDPASADASVSVPINATAATPYTFKDSDFPYMDEDGDSLASITISAATAGTFRNDGAAVTASTTVTAANLGNLSFYPPSGTPATPNFATFTFSVNDGSADSEDYTMTINLVPPGEPPSARPATHTAMLAGTEPLEIPASAFINAYSDPDGDALSSVTITSLPPTADGTLSFGGTAVAANQILSITDNDFMGGPLRFTPAATATDLQSTSFNFRLSDGFNSSSEETLTLRFGQDIDATEVTEVAAVFNAATVATAANAIMGAISASPSTFALSLDGTPLDTDGHAAWFHGTTPANEHNAARNSADSPLAMAAMNWQAGDSAMRFWARYQSIDLSGNEGVALEYDGSGTGFYLGADRQINDKMRLGLAISSDSADIALRLDDDMMDDDATRSATTIYPYLQMDLGNNNHLRVIAGIGSGDLDIKSTANDSTASAGLSWNMLAASISHHRPMKGKLSARFDGSLQLGNSSTDATTFTNGSTLAAADASTNEIAVNAELRYKNNNFTPFASLSGRKLGGDLSQSLAMDLGLGADLQTGAAILRLAITRQLNDTTHKRDSLSLDVATIPNQSGLSASLGSRYDSLSGRPQWQSTVRWQRRTRELILAASPSDLRLQARLRW